MKEPKFFIKIDKAYQDNGDWFVQGVASGTLEDRDEEKMSKAVLEKFASSMPLPLTDNHPRDGDILAELGKVVDAKVLEDDNNSLFVKAQLDLDHPAVPYMVKQIQKGKKYAFSVEGIKPMTKQVWSDNLKKMVTEYTDVVPKAISITTEPSYTPSFMEVVNKSYKYNLSLETTMEKAKSKKVKPTEPEEVKVKEVKTEVPEEEVLETVPEEVVEEMKPEEVEETPDEEKVETEPEPTEPDVVGDDLGKSVDKKEEKVTKQLDVEEITEAVQEADEEKMEEEQEEEEDQREYELLMGLCMKVDQLAEVIQGLVDSDKEVHSMMGETSKSIEQTDKLLKSFHDELEIMKDLPLQKKSRVVAKSINQRLEEEDDKPKTIQDIVANLI